MAESSLTGFLVKQAFKSRKEAKAEKARQDKVVKDGGKVDDKDRKGLFRKAFTKNLFGGLFGGRSATGGGNSTATGAMLGGGKKKKQKQPKGGGGKPSGGKAKGLEKILLTGFGSLAADTTAISGGLAALTEIMNSQLNIEGDMSSGIQGINAILADQLEVQTSFLDALGFGGGLGGGGGDGGIAGMFGNTSVAGVGGNGSSFTQAMFENLQRLKDLAMSFGGGAALQSARQAGMQGLAQAGTAVAPAAAVLGVGALLSAGGEGMFQLGKMGDQSLKDRRKLIEEKKARGENTFLDETLQVGQTGLGEVGKTLGVAADVGGAPVRMLGELIANPFLNEKQKEEQAMNLAKYDTRIREHARGWMNRIDFLNVISDEKGGFGNIYGNQAATKEMAGKMAAGGTNAMIGEAGKEAVVPLHSADSPAKSKVGMDPSMQASAGSMLAVTDQFIKSMGALGGPVSQALGSDISNLAKTFGMSQTLPNLSIGGGKFKEDTSSKKNREKFVKDLIAGSLESLGAKKKETAPAAPPPPPPPPPPPQTEKEQKKQSNPSNPSTGSVSQRQTAGADKPMDGQEPGSEQVTNQGGADHGRTSSETAKGNLTSTTVTQRTFPFTHTGDGQRYKVLLNYTNGDYEVFKVGAGFAGTDQPVDLSNPKKGGLNEALLQRAHKIVVEAYEKHAPGRGQAVKYIPPSKESGGSIKPQPMLQAEGGLDWLWKWLTTPMGQGASNKVVGGLQDSARQGNLGGMAKNMRNVRDQQAEYMKLLRPQESGGTTQSIKQSSAPKVSAASYVPMATPMTESTDIGAIVNIVSNQSQQSIPVAPPQETQSTAELVNSPFGSGLAFSVLSTNHWGG